MLGAGVGRGAVFGAKSAGAAMGLGSIAGTGVGGSVISVSMAVGAGSMLGNGAAVFFVVAAWRVFGVTCLARICHLQFVWPVLLLVMGVHVRGVTSSSSSGQSELFSFCAALTRRVELEGDLAWLKVILISRSAGGSSESSISLQGLTRIVGTR